MSRLPIAQSRVRTPAKRNEEGQRGHHVRVGEMWADSLHGWLLTSFNTAERGSLRLSLGTGDQYAHDG